jgi:hypothetical protein
MFVSKGFVKVMLLTAYRNAGEEEKSLPDRERLGIANHDDEVNQSVPSQGFCMP